ncbi:VOC family protein [Ferrimonas marina]|uniref:Uncharacterized protein n=1 Tax=Ferrimonas marina TaxID=299255 RepID=A0A1M5P1D2_9GAMM|nr:VOC family protein [Ferrimonas marina]SHG95525.1 hypothetical protein SAMN02745129_1251 [Ferrimonas marina]
MRAVVALFFLLFALSVRAEFPPIAGGEQSLSLPGKVVWHDLFSSDPRASATFYQRVFGWQIVALENEPYWLFYHDNQPLAGMVMREEPDQSRAGAIWIPHFSSSNLDPSSTLAKRSRWLMPPRKMGQRGVQAIGQDPQGGIFGLLKSEAGDPQDSAAGPGEFGWHMLFTPKADDASEFYQKMLLVEREPDNDSWLLNSAGVSRAVISPAKTEQDDRGAVWLAAIVVQDLDESATQALAAGASWLVEPQDGDSIYLMIDPVGALFGLMGVTEEVSP